MRLFGFVEVKHFLAQSFRRDLAVPFLNLDADGLAP
jgi:hypothetical protein